MTWWWKWQSVAKFPRSRRCRCATIVVFDHGESVLLPLCQVYLCRTLYSWVAHGAVLSRSCGAVVIRSIRRLFPHSAACIVGQSQWQSQSAAFFPVDPLFPLPTFEFPRRRMVDVISSIGSSSRKLELTSSYTVVSGHVVAVNCNYIL